MQRIPAEPTVAVVGATGAVGEELLALLAERRFPVRNLRLFASARSAGRTLHALGRDVTVEPLVPGMNSPMSLLPTVPMPNPRPG